MIPHKELLKFYTKCIILANIRQGMSLSEIQSKTSLSYATIHQIIQELEKQGIIKTISETSNKGRIRKIILVSDTHKEISELFLKVADICYSIFYKESKKIILNKKDYPTLEKYF